MKTLAGLLLVLAVVAPASAANLIVNGDWNAGETGWTRWNSPWAGGTYSWNVDGAAAGNPAPAGHLQINGGQASFGWVQGIEVVPGTSYTLTADWTGSNVQWCEVLFFNDDGRGVYDQLDAPVGGAIIAKHSDTSNPTFGWQPITTAPYQLAPNTIVATGSMTSG